MGRGGEENGTISCILRPYPTPLPQSLTLFHHPPVMQEACSPLPVLPSPRELRHIWSCSWVLHLGPFQGKELAEMSGQAAGEGAVNGPNVGGREAERKCLGSAGGEMDFSQLWASSITALCLKSPGLSCPLCP